MVRDWRPRLVGFTSVGDMPIRGIIKVLRGTLGTTSNERMLGLTLWNGHRNIDTRPEDVLSIFCRELSQLHLIV